MRTAYAYINTEDLFNMSFCRDSEANMYLGKYIITQNKSRHRTVMLSETYEK